MDMANYLAQHCSMTQAEVLLHALDYVEDYTEGWSCYAKQPMQLMHARPVPSLCIGYISSAS